MMRLEDRSTEMGVPEMVIGALPGVIGVPAMATREDPRTRVMRWSATVASAEAVSTGVDRAEIRMVDEPTMRLEERSTNTGVPEMVIGAFPGVTGVPATARREELSIRVMIWFATVARAEAASLGVGRDGT